MIVLDWTKPWTFVSQLQLWLAWVETWVKGDGSRDLDVQREENRERRTLLRPLYLIPNKLTGLCVLVQSYIQRYTEPNTDSIPTTSTVNDTLLPLGPGTLTHNTSGVPIIVVCAKADLIDDQGDPLVGGSAGMGGMVKGKGSEWEEQTDGVMQVLRVICLKCKSRSGITTVHVLICVSTCRWCGTFLHDPDSPDPSTTASVCIAYALRTSSPISRYFDD